MKEQEFDETGIPIYPIKGGGLAIDIAIKKHPNLIPFLKSTDPPRIDNYNREGLLLYNEYIAKDIYDLDINLEPTKAIIPTPVLRYHFINQVLHYHNYPAGKEGLSAINTESPEILELGTGASAIIALLAAKKFKAKVMATEVDPLYLEYARKNIERNNLQNQIKLVNSHGNYIENAIPKNMKFDFILSNPPYYDSIRSPKVLWGGAKHELVGNGEKGEVFILKMIEEGWNYTKTPGMIAFILPKTRQNTLIAVESYLNEHNFDYDIIGIQAGNRLRFVFRIYKL
jgi:methylase of polypeptide subunit release factors